MVSDKCVQDVMQTHDQISFKDILKFRKGYNALSKLVVMSDCPKRYMSHPTHVHGNHRYIKIRESWHQRSRRFLPGKSGWRLV